MDLDYRWMLQDGRQAASAPAQARASAPSRQTPGTCNGRENAGETVCKILVPLKHQTKGLLKANF
ncbi:hypothetical protein GCM10027514_38470 [Azotobacter armeniacus]